MVYMNQHAMWKYCIAHKWGRMYIYTEYARSIYINKHIYRQFSVFTTSVGLVALAPISKYIDNYPQVWGSLRSPQLHSILRYAESSRGFTEIKQVSACSIQVCRGSMGFNAWNTFVLRVEHPYIVRKSEKFLDMGELTFYAEKTAS